VTLNHVITILVGCVIALHSSLNTKTFFSLFVGPPTSDNNVRVKIVVEIYRQATRVFVWLGQETDQILREQTCASIHAKLPHLAKLGLDKKTAWKQSFNTGVRLVPTLIASS
jgi:hypothetical protein